VAKQPMYLQIAEDLRRQIEVGSLEGQVPTEHDLREKYGVSRNTVRDAIARLTEMHLVEATPGKGTFVTKPVGALRDRPVPPPRRRRRREPDVPRSDQGAEPRQRGSSGPTYSFLVAVSERRRFPARHHP
jgi:DNA-binding transcriptional MocR family regulator